MTTPDAEGCDTTRTGDVTTVTVRGALDAVTAAGFTASARGALAGLAPPHTVVVDLRAVDFVAAAGARALFDLDDRCRAAGLGCLLVAGPDHDVRTVLARLDRAPAPRLAERLPVPLAAEPS